MTRRPKSSRPRPVTRTRTEAQAEQEAITEAAYKHTVRGRAFRYIMIRGHGCTGLECDSPDHDGHLRDRLLPALMAMDVIPDPERVRRYHWGSA